MAKGSRWELETPVRASEVPYKSEHPEGEALVLKDVTLQKNLLGHYCIVGYLPGGVRVAGWLHERPLS